MDDNSRLNLMKDRIVESYAWKRDIIEPLSDEFECTPEELKEVFFKLFDMSTLEAFHSTFESAEDLCLAQRFHADLRLCWFISTLEVITLDEGDKLKNNLVNKVKSGKNYSDVLKEGQLDLFQLLKEKSK